MPARNLAAQLRANGWTIRDAADYLGVSRQRLYSVFADRNRARLWECAVAGMPACTPEIAAELREARTRKPRPARTRPAPIVRIEVGDGVVATAYAGIADEAEEGWIVDVRGEGADMRLLVRMPDGEDWFPLADFHDFFMTNGKTITPGV